MKILITGSAGFVGKNVFNRLKHAYEVFGVSRRSSPTTTHVCDINSSNFDEVLAEIAPDIIIHSAALSGVDYCETHPQEAHLNNVAATKKIVDWARINNKRVIYISTDYIYSGKTNFYNESSKSEPLNIYGKTKLEAEGLVKTLSDFLILRPTVIFGYDEGGNNFLMQLLSLKEPRPIPTDQISNPTDVTVLCDYVHDSIKGGLKGTWVATGPESMDRYAFALLIADVFNLNSSLFIPTRTEQLNQKTQRPLNNGTNSTALRSALNYSCPSIRESLVTIKDKINALSA